MLPKFSALQCSAPIRLTFPCPFDDSLKHVICRYDQICTVSLDIFCNDQLTSIEARLSEHRTVMAERLLQASASGRLAAVQRCALGVKKIVGLDVEYTFCTTAFCTYKHKAD